VSYFVLSVTIKSLSFSLHKGEAVVCFLALSNKILQSCVLYIEA
jgi:hypothetical protein